MGTIRFTGNMPTWLIFVIAIVSAIAVLYFYLRETQTLNSPANFLIPSLRASAIAMVILMFSGPVWHRTTTVGTLGRVVFAIDVSQSMSAIDSRHPDTADSTQSRLHRASRLLLGTSIEPGWLEMLAKTHDVEVIAFSSGAPVMVSVPSGSPDDHTQRISIDNASTALPDLATIAADGSATDIGAALASSLVSISGGQRVEENQISTDADSVDSVLQPSAVVILSEGRNNHGVSPTDMAKRLKSAGSIVHCIGIGSQDEPPDVGIVRIDRPDQVAADAILAGEIILEQNDLNGKAIQVRIETSDGKTVWQTEVIPKAGEGDAGRRQSVSFELDVKGMVEGMGGNAPRGVRQSAVVLNLKAVVNSEGESDFSNANLSVNGNVDQSSRNNALSFRVAASTRKRRLLILDGSSRWETRYLRNLFERDPAWSVNTVLFGPGTDSPRLQRGDQTGQYPERLDTLAKYDAVILGEVPPDQFDQNDGHLLRDFVTRGGGLIVIDGQYDRIAKIIRNRLSELIPVRPGEENNRVPKSIAPTRQGLDHPMMKLVNDASHLNEFWNQLPAPTSTVSVTPQPGAEVWAEVIDIAGQRTPWLVTRLFGSGRVFYFSTDQTWRWRYKVGDRFHARFWNQVVTAVMQPPYSANDEYVSVGTDKIDYATGERAIIRARLQNSNGEPVGDATVDALLVSGNHVVATVPMSLDDPDRGSYIGQTSTLATGAYELRIRASGFDEQALRATTPIWVGDQPTAEWNRISLDEETLKQVALAGGGEYRHESAADEILNMLKPLSTGQIIESDYQIWQSFPWFSSVIGLLALEWYLRKRNGLV